MEYTFSRVGSLSKIDKRGWRLCLSRAQSTGRFVRKPSHNCRNEHGIERRGKCLYVEEFGPASADEDVVQEAEEFMHLLAPVLPTKAEVEAHNVSHLPSRSWCSACVRAEDFHLVIVKST